MLTVPCNIRCFKNRGWDSEGNNLVHHVMCHSYLGPVYTMDHGRWPFSMLRVLAKSLGPSLGVNQMYTKRNDHGPKNESAYFF